MRIISITKHQSKKNRYIVEFENSEECEILSETLLFFGLRKGDDISEGKINEIELENSYINAKNYIFRLLAKRGRSEKEIITKLKFRKVESSVIDRVLELLKKLNLINDEELTQKFINDLILLKRPMGNLAIKQKLYKYGIEKDLISKTLKDNLTEEIEFDLALMAAKKKLKLLNRIPEEKKKMKLYQFLLNRGFSFNLIKKVMDKIKLGVEEE